MNLKKWFIVLVIIVFASLAFGAKTIDVLGTKVNVDSIHKSDSTIAIEGGMLRIRTGHEHRWPGVTIKAPKGKWDLSGYQWVKMTVANNGAKTVTVALRVDNPGADGRNNCITGNTEVPAGESKPIIVTLAGAITPDKPVEIIGMRGSPYQNPKIDPANINQILVFVADPKEDYDFSIGNIIYGGKTKKMKSEDLIPFIDELGQFMHKDWPGKCYSVEDIKKKGSQEQQYLKKNPGPKQWNKYGGWMKGPKLKATGFFRVEKYKEKWWLVDPDGRLFWSHGIDCVGDNTSTPISDREHYFKELPKEDSPLARFYGRGSWAPHGYYAGKGPYRHYDFGKANLFRKYGENYFEKYADVSHKRLRSWGMNTIANWSDGRIYKMQRTPYVITLGISSKNIEGSEGYWKKFPDVFDNDYRMGIRKKLIQRREQDPWCIGYFVSNELSWGSDTSLAIAALRSPPEQKAKKVFIEDLRNKYGTIDKLNAAWGKEFHSWLELINNTDDPKIETEEGKKDLKEFYSKTAETYFRVIKEEMNKVVPQRLYLGCRFAWVNDAAAIAGSKYCDVVSYNRYKYSVEDLKLPEGSVDKPLIIGEFHFGALDRGMFHTGLRKAKDQDERADHYRNYVLGALGNPAIVGTHWFQYRDQATTGRGDGENYQIGFVDVCDKPHYEIVTAASEVGRKMYEYRLKGD